MKRTILDHWMELQEGFPLELPVCPKCNSPKHPIELIDDGDGFVCSMCLIDREREKPQPRNLNEEWNNIKGQRNLLLEKYAWTIRRGSPLNNACQMKFEALFKKLHRLTVDHKKPEDVVWPEIPTLEYGD